MGSKGRKKNRVKKKKKHDNLKSTKSEPEGDKQECHTSSHSKEKQQLTLP